MASDSLAQGTYVVVNASTGKVMGVPSEAWDGSNVTLQDWWFWDGFDETVYYSGTKAKVINELAGRLFDVGDGTASSALTVKGADKNRVQSFNIVPTGLTMTFQGDTIDTYYIEVGDSLVLGANGGYVSVTAKGGSSSTEQHWGFWNNPEFMSGGLFEIRSKQDTTMCAQIQSDSNASGARLVMGYADGSNGDKFWFLPRDGGGYSIVNARSSLSLSVDNSQAVDGATVSQRDNSMTTDNQHWAVEYLGGVVVDGVPSADVTIGNYLSSDPDSYLLDSYLQDRTSDARVAMRAANGDGSQRWVLRQTKLNSGSLPVPANVGMTAAVGEYPEQFELPITDTFYPCWDCTDGWATGGPNHFEYMYQWSYIDEYGRGDAWFWNVTGGETWTPVEAQYDGTRVWMRNGITLPSQDKWLYMYNFYVRCVSQVEVADWDASHGWWHQTGTTHLENVAGQQNYASLLLYRRPTVSLTAAGVSPNGLRIEYESNYSAGRTNLYITSIVDNGGKDWLVGDMEFQSLDQRGSVFIPCERVAGLAGGTEVTVTYEIGTDKVRRMDGEESATLMASYTSGDDGEQYSEGIATLTYTFDYTTRMVVATLPHYSGGKEYLWRQTAKSTTPVTGKTSGNVTTYRVPYAYGSGITLLASVVNTDGDVWGVSRTTIGGAGSALEREYPPAHVWVWDGGSFVIEANDNPLETHRTFEAVYEEHILNKRARSVVTFAHTVRSEFEVEGMLYEGVTNSTVEGLIALVDAKHVTYYAPSGEEATVAVVGADYTRHGRYTKVTVQMIEETI